jgi:hypothetical protein
MADIVITKNLVRDLQDSLRRNVPPPPNNRPAECHPSDPPFGSIYFGSFNRFANGKPHYGMVCGNGRQAANQGYPAVKLCPITSKLNTGSMVMILPPGELPPKIGSDGIRRLVVSYVLLYMQLVVDRTTLARDFARIKQLAERYCEEARLKMRGRP